jgi:hypothetical protein
MSKTKFLSACLGVAAVIFSIGFLIRSVAPAHAAPAPEEFIQENTNKIGKYMMTLSPETSTTYEIVFIWDTETGASAKYIKNNTAGTYQKSTIQLPEKPM